MEQAVIEVNGYGVAFMPLKSAAVTLAKTVNLPPKKPSRPKSNELSGSSTIAWWGEDNLFPQNVYAESRKNTLIPSTLSWKARAGYASGVIYGRITGFDAEGNEQFQRLYLPELEKFWLRQMRLRKYLLQSWMDLYWFYNPFAEFILNRDRQQIVSLQANKAMYCRWSLHDERGRSRFCYLNANWHLAENEESPETVKLPALDTEQWEPEHWLKEASGFKYAYPLSCPSPGESYYQLAPWNSVRESGWLEFANSIPQFKKALMANQLSIKYHIEIAEWWFESKYGVENWKKFPAPKRQELFKAELKAFNDRMAGTEGTGMSIATLLRSDPKLSKEYSSWKINELNTKNLPDGVFLEDGLTANQHLLYALEVPSSLLGNAPGKSGIGAGSGSDVREHFNAYMALCTAHEDIILEPIRFIHQYNSMANPGMFPQDLIYRIPRPQSSTLNQIAPEKRTPSTENA